MKFKTYQSAIGIFIVSIVAIFLYIFLEDDLHKRIVIYSAFSVIIIWSALLINHRRKTAKKLRAMTKACILGDNNNGEYCDKVKRRMSRYAEKKGKTYEMVAEEIRNQILKKKGAGWKKSMQIYGQPIKPEKDEHLQTSSRVEEVNDVKKVPTNVYGDFQEYDTSKQTDEQNYLIEKTIECLTNENSQGKICESIINNIKEMAKERGQAYDRLSQDILQQAFNRLVIRGKGGGNDDDDIDYGQFDGASGYGQF